MAHRISRRELVARLAQCGSGLLESSVSTRWWPRVLGSPGKARASGSVQISFAFAALLAFTVHGYESVYPHLEDSHRLSRTNVAAWLANGTANGGVAQIGGDYRGRIAFVSNRGRDNDIYLMWPDGTDIVNVTNHPASDRLPAWSPNGSQIAFRSTRHGNTEIYVMNDDGSGVVRLTNHPAVDTAPSWTSDGRVLFSSNRSGRFEIYVVNPDGSDLQHIEIAVEGDLTFPAESHSGHRLAFVATNFFDTAAIWIAHPDGSHAEQLTADELVAAFPDWSPTGNRVVVSNNACPVCDLSEIMFVNQGGNRLRQLTDSNDMFNDLLPRWSPDGSQVVVSRDDFINPTEIYIMNADGSGVTNISNHPAFDFEADWGPFRIESPGSVDFDVLFRPAGAPAPMDCQQANVSQVRIDVFDSLDGILRSSLQRPCIPGERFLLTIDLGPYTIRAQGLNDQQTICYESSVPVTVQSGQTERLSIVAEQHPHGAAQGCVYPSAP